MMPVRPWRSVRASWSRNRAGAAVPETGAEGDGMKMMLCALGTLAAALSTGPSAAQPAARQPAGQGSAAHARFDRFFEDFRRAVLANDREAVADMTRFPFIDYRAGYYCEPGVADCVVPEDALTANDRAAFLARYDQIITPKVVAALRERRLRGFLHGIDDGEAPGPIRAGEQLLDADDVDDQRVFARHGGLYKLDRVPFYS